LQLQELAFPKDLVLLYAAIFNGLLFEHHLRWLLKLQGLDFLFLGRFPLDFFATFGTEEK
jgi:hypothetical protein